MDLRPQTDMLPANAQIPDIKIDPAFAYPATGSLDTLDGCDAGSVWRHLSGQVARDGLDIEAHVRRVRVAAQLGDSTLRFSALIDLFLALGNKGQRLRRLLLQTVGTDLPPGELRFLEASLDSGLNRGQDLPLGTHSVLDDGVISHGAMVHHTRVEAAAMTTIEQAAALLDEGDLTAARSLLEAAVINNPQDLAVGEELLAVYRHTRDTEAEAAMRKRLAAQLGQAPAPWA